MPKLIKWIFLTGLFFLLLMTAARLVHFWWFRPAGVSLSEALPAFGLGLRYDLRIVGIVELILLLAGSWGWLHPFRSNGTRRFWRWYFGIFGSLLTLFYTFDFAHYSYLQQRLNASVLNYAEDAGISAGMVWQSYPVIRILLGIIIAIAGIVLLLRLLQRRVAATPAHASRRSRILWFIGMFLLLSLGIFGRLGQFPLRWSDAFALGSDYESNLALNPLQSFFSTLSFRHSSYDEKKLKEYYPVVAQYLGVAQPDSNRFVFERKGNPSPGAVTSQPNVVLVICESFSAYKSSMWGNPLNTTPFFDSMSRGGIFFDHCFTPHFGTARGVWATITGIPDVQLNKTASRNPATVNQHTILNNFTGYEKLYFLGGSTSWANIRGLLTNNINGLQLYEEGNYKAKKIDVWGISDKNLFLEANAMLRRQTRPFFAIIQTADNHRPYTIPEEDRAQFQLRQFSADSLKKYGFESNDEMNAFRYTDFCFQQFMEAARQEKYFSNTIFVFVGDHGIRGDAGNMFPRVWTEQGLTCEHVPLLFYAPQLLQPRRISDICSQTDILPTIAGLSNITYRNTTLGRNLLDTLPVAPAAFIIDHDEKQIGLLRGNYYYVRQLSSGREQFVQLYPGKSSADSAGKDFYRRLTLGIYEASRWMLYNNKK
jgi:phosphoglycerol transferase MdoB-like AlkP superfamily enzyme